MKKNVLQNEIYGKVKDMILSGACPFNKLPQERILAHELGVSRGTLRAVLARLEDERVIERSRVSGTCFKNHETHPLLTYLIPCSMDLMQSEVVGFSLIELNRSLLGAIRATENTNARLEIFPVSRTNDARNPDWDKLKSITSTGRVLMHSTWYHTLFGFFRNLGCRVVLINEGEPLPDGAWENTESFARLEMDNREMFRRLTHALLARGAKHLCACAGTDGEEAHPRLLGFYDALEEAGIPISDASVVRFPQGESEKHTNEAILPRLRAAYLQRPFDALIVESSILAYMPARSEIARRIGCGPELRLATFNTGGANLDALSDVLRIDFDIMRIAKDAAELLLAPEWNPVRRRYAALPIRTGPE